MLHDGAPARFLRSHLKNYARRILGQTFSININSIVFNEVPIDIVKRCDNHTLRGWYTFINIFKTALYLLSYRRSLFDRDGIGTIRTFNHHLRAVKKAAEERKSDILDTIWSIPERDDYVLPFYKILNELHQDTAYYRRQDNKDYCFLSDYRKKLTRAQNFQKKQNIPMISQGKKQILIDNAFQRVFKSADMTKGQRIELCSKTENSV